MSPEPAGAATLELSITVNGIFGNLKIIVMQSISGKNRLRLWNERIGMLVSLFKIRIHPQDVVVPFDSESEKWS